MHTVFIILAAIVLASAYFSGPRWLQILILFAGCFYVPWVFVPLFLVSCILNIPWVYIAKFLDKFSSIGKIVQETYKDIGKPTPKKVDTDSKRNHP